MLVSYEGMKIPEATLLQKQLRDRIDTGERNRIVSLVGAADISLNLYSTTIYAGIVLLSFPRLQPVAYSLVKAETRFPYVPGFLAFREVPALVQVWDQMQQRPDVLVVDGHGIAHPRRLGIATHFGIVTGQPSMGCAKKLLYGKYDEPGPEPGAASPLWAQTEQIGYVLRSKAKTAPVFVSPGHLIGMEDSLELIRSCMGRYRIPEPTRLAHELVNRFRKGELPGGYHVL